MKANGFGLIEVLVALIIISVGLLGLAALNINAYRLSLESQFRMAASLLASNLSNRMKMNFIDARKGQASGYVSDGIDHQCNQVLCNSLQMAQFDIYEIKEQTKTLLPSGEIQVCVDSSGLGNCNGIATANTVEFTIKVSWKGRNNVSQSFLTTVRP